VSDVDENRLIEIETKLAHHEHLVLELNQVIADQQQQIAQLELKCQALLDRIKSLADGGSGPAETDEQPPHY
jgi:SlyX protein